MTTSVGFVRRWAMQRSPLPLPPIVDLSIPALHLEGRDQRVVGQIELPMLDQPGIESNIFAAIIPAKVSVNLAQIAVDLMLDDLSLADWRPEHYVDELAAIPAPQMANVKFSIFDAYPQLLDLFTNLTAPDKAGKAYGEPVEMEQASLFSTDGVHRSSVPRSSQNCIHGLQTDYCEICRNKRLAKQQQQKKRTKPMRTLDVFDLLLPYLQPPLDQLLAQPLLFPVGRRPLDYQVTGIKFLAEREAALLGDEMGLGKTIQTIVALQVLYRRGDVRQTLILCPRSLLGTWEKEIDKWAPELYVQKVRGTKEEREMLWETNATIYLTTYETLRGDMQSIPALAAKFQVAILDEIQKIKNPNSAMARAVRRLHSRYRWGLSGTPLENKLEDVTAIYRYLLPGLFKSDTVYTPQQVQKAMAPYFLRRRTADVMKQLPDKDVQEIWLELTDAQQTAYQRIEEDGKRRLEQPDVTRVHVFALIGQLKQICNLEPKSGESCKLDYLIEQLESIIENEQKALVFSHLPNATLVKIEPRLKPFYPALFDGTLSDKRREAILDDFQNRAHPAVLLMSVQAGGVGLTLTRANYVFHFDHWWNPAVARQAEGRAHRMGQKQTVFVHDLYTVNTVEERIHKLLQDKQHLFDTVIDDLSAEYVQKSIDDAELFGLFDLAPPTDPDRSRHTGIRERVGQLFQPRQRQQSQEVTEDDSTSESKPKNSINGLSPVQFEHLIGQLYRRMGYKVNVTKQSRDHGVDVLAQRLTHQGTELAIIQCKHYPNGTVGEPEVRNFVGAWQEYRQAQYAVLVTSGSFSNDAIVFAKRHQITLVDRQGLLQWIEQYKK